MKIPIRDKTFDDDRFIFAHQQEKLSLISSKSKKGVYILMFSKANLNFRFESDVGNEHILAKTFRIVLLHQICRFIKLYKESKSTCDKVNQIIHTISLSSLEEDVKGMLSNFNLRRIYCTMEYFFQESYGTLTNICDGFELYPSINFPVFVPPLAMSKYIRDRKNILFYNRYQVFNVLFDNYDLNDYITILNPSPVYNPECNYVVRNFHTSVCDIQPKFQFQSEKQAKLCSVEINDLNEYIFLLRFHDTFYQVLAIYPPKMVKKNMNILRKNNKLDIKGTDINRVISHINLEENTHITIKLMFETLSPDNIHCDKISFHLYEWLMLAVKHYFNDLTYVTTLTTNPTEHLEVLNFGDLRVYNENGYFQLLLKVNSSLFFYTQVKLDPVEFVQVYCDDKVGNSSEDLRIIRFTSLIRLLVHYACAGSMSPFLNIQDVGVHKQILLQELKLGRLLNLWNISKNIIL